MAGTVTPVLKCETCQGNYGRFVTEPLENGLGTTVGNALRRVLLGSLVGAAVTAVKIEGIEHEFSHMPDIKEDTIEFLLNVKQIRLRALSDSPGKLMLEVSGGGPVCAGDIKPSADFEIVNPEQHLATLNSAEAKLTVELHVAKGKGYVPAGHVENLPIGVIPVDAIFTPVRRVNYTVEKTRVEQVTNYDRLILDVWTDGTITPMQAVENSARLLIEHFSLFSNLERLMQEGAEGRATPAIPPEKYDTPIETLGLSARTLNCLRRGNITKVGQVLEKSDEALLKGLRNFGEKSLAELKKQLAAHGFMDAAEAEAAIVAAEAEGAAAEGEPEAEEDTEAREVTRGQGAKR